MRSAALAAALLAALAPAAVTDAQSRRWTALHPSTGRPLRGVRREDRAPPMKVAREHLAGTALGGSFYVLAGRSAGAGNLATAERYDPGKRRWRTLPSLPKPTGGTVGTAANGRIVVFGGEETAGTIAATQQYDPKRRRWRLLAPTLTPRHGLGAASYRGRIYALEGGRQPGFAFSNVIESLRVG